MSEPREWPTVVYIAGWERSGTTLLAKLLAELPGIRMLGELHHLWRGPVSHLRCGCGATLTNCDTWRSILANVNFSDSQTRGRQLRTRLVQVHRTFKVMRRPPRTDVDQYAWLTERIYRQTADKMLASVVVDSSKTPTFAALLLHMRSIDPFLVHLVRDPRAVAFSWQRRPLESVARSMAYSTSRWILWNAGVELVKRGWSSARQMTLRYEDLASDPAAVVEHIERALGRAPTGIERKSDGCIEFGINHSVEGNPARFTTGDVRVTPDDEWLEALPKLHAAAITVVTSVMLRRYGYPILRYGTNTTTKLGS